MTAAQNAAPDEVAEAPTLRELVAAEVRAQMARERISNRRFAAKLGLKPAWVDRRLNGTTPLDTDDIQLFANELKVSVDDLLRRAVQQFDSNSGKPLSNDRYSEWTSDFISQVPQATNVVPLRPVGPPTFPECA